MGLTVAEAFMLIAFVLLMLLLFWRYQVQDDLEFMQNLSQEQRQALNDGHKLVPPGRLAILVKRERLVANPAQRRLAEEAAKLPPEQLRKLTDMARNPQALATDTTLVAKDRLTALGRAGTPRRQSGATQAGGGSGEAAARAVAQADRHSPRSSWP